MTAAVVWVQGMAAFAKCVFILDGKLGFSFPRSRLLFWWGSSGSEGSGAALCVGVSLGAVAGGVSSSSAVLLLDGRCHGQGEH